MISLRTLSSLIFLLICILTLAEVFIFLPNSTEITATLICIFVAIEFTKIPLPQQISGLILVVISIICGLVSDEWRSIILDGLARTSIFLVLFFAVTWLQFPVNDSPSLKATRDHITSRDPRKRFLYLAFGVHALGSILNIAGLSLLTKVVKDAENIEVKRRLSISLMLGFASVSCWSPFFIGMIVVLMALPGLKWVDFAVYGFLMSVFMILGASYFDRIVHAKQKLNNEPNRVTKFSTIILIKSFSILLLLISITLSVVEIFQVNIPIALTIVAPPFSLIWFAQQKIGKLKIFSASTKLVRMTITDLPRLRNEALVFGAANMFGLGIASVLPQEDLSQTINTVFPWADVKIILIIITMILLSALGLHPVITVISISTIFPPHLIGIDKIIIALAFLGCWGLSTSMSPFSGTTLFMSRVTDTPPHQIGWYWMPILALPSTIIVAIFVIGLRNMIF